MSHYREVYRTRLDLGFLNEVTPRDIDVAIGQSYKNRANIQAMIADNGLNLPGYGYFYIRRWTIRTDTEHDVIEEYHQDRLCKVADWYDIGHGVTTGFYINVVQHCIPRGQMESLVNSGFFTSHSDYFVKHDDLTYYSYNSFSYTMEIYTDNFNETTFRKTVDITIPWMCARNLNLVHDWCLENVTTDVPPELNEKAFADRLDDRYFEFIQAQIEQIKAAEAERKAREREEANAKLLDRLENLQSEIQTVAYKQKLEQGSRTLLDLSDDIRSMEERLIQYKQRRDEVMKSMQNAVGQVAEIGSKIPSVLRNYKNIVCVKINDPTDKYILDTVFNITSTITLYDTKDAKGLFNQQGMPWSEYATIPFILDNIAKPIVSTNFALTLRSKSRSTGEDTISMNISGVDNSYKGNPHLEYYNCWGSYEHLKLQLQNNLDVNGIINLANQVNAGLSLLDTAVVSKLKANYAHYTWVNKDGNEVPHETIYKYLSCVREHHLYPEEYNQLVAYGKSLWNDNAVEL